MKTTPKNLQEFMAWLNTRLVRTCTDLQAEYKDHDTIVISKTNKSCYDYFYGDIVSRIQAGAYVYKVSILICVKDGKPVIEATKSIF